MQLLSLQNIYPDWIRCNHTYIFICRFQSYWYIVVPFKIYQCHTCFWYLYR